MLVGGSPYCPLCEWCEGLGWLKFDSEGEAHRWDDLVRLQGAGGIRQLRRQVAYPLHTLSPTGELLEVARFVADFTYTREEVVQIGAGEARRLVQVVEDYKGYRTAMYNLKRKWLKLEYGITIEEVQSGR